MDDAESSGGNDSLEGRKIILQVLLSYDACIDAG